MKILHTSDWHLGRRLRGRDRTPEIAYALEQILSLVETQQVDAVLIAGDIFDTANPSAEAEKVAYEFFAQLHKLAVPAVAIAGNHDAAGRIDSLAPILAPLNIHLLGRPRPAQKGGLIQLNTRSGPLNIGAIPFASERRLLRAEDLWERNETEQGSHYMQVIRHLFNQLSVGFTADAVNVVMGHLTFMGSKKTGSEIRHHSEDTYELSSQLIPSTAQYAALGHIHQPQQISHATPTYYSGSLIQVDFGEAGQEKGVNLITVEPGRPAKVEFYTIPCLKPLQQVFCTIRNVEEVLDEYQEHPGFLKVSIDLEKPEFGLGDRIRKICPQALIIEVNYPLAPQDQPREPITTENIDLAATYGQYYEQRGKGQPNPAVLNAFVALHEEFSHAAD
ncbi:MAG: metallophosphoesterase family protein [Spirulinaceae cyanobacterium]